ncbi:hypothetical protein CEXT_438661 [Caerostris extrusa]|uniref:Uncharacterized protein n=1 Tax=Caerostris extrusa TaxID=172846 RepID=A0AAV4X2M4_CAEEX|nr:hypothetical protein CEXT_438661 [Caerostris extrusa]
MYSYLDPNGILRVVRYNAAPGTGYQAFGEGIPQIGSASLEEHKPDSREAYQSSNQNLKPVKKVFQLFLRPKITKSQMQKAHQLRIYYRLLRCLKIDSH